MIPVSLELNLVTLPLKPNDPNLSRCATMKKTILPIKCYFDGEVHAFKVLDASWMANPENAERTAVNADRDGHYFGDISICGGAIYHTGECYTLGTKMSSGDNTIGQTWELVTCDGCALLRYDLEDPKRPV